MPGNQEEDASTWHEGTWLNLNASKAEVTLTGRGKESQYLLYILLDVSFHLCLKKTVPSSVGQLHGQNVCLFDFYVKLIQFTGLSE